MEQKHTSLMVGSCHAGCIFTNIFFSHNCFRLQYLEISPPDIVKEAKRQGCRLFQLATPPKQCMIISSYTYCLFALDNSFLPRVGSCLRAISQVQFTENIAYMSLDGAHADHQLFSNLFVGIALAISLSTSMSRSVSKVKGVASSGYQIAECVNHPACNPGMQSGFSPGSTRRIASSKSVAFTSFNRYDIAPA